MEKFIISIEDQQNVIDFEIREYPHLEEHSCKFEVYQDDKFVAGFEPDLHGVLHLCKDNKIVDPKILDEICTNIEKSHWQHLIGPYF